MAPHWSLKPLASNVSLADLPITDPHCTNRTCKAFTVGYDESQKVISLLSQVEYGKWTIYFYAFWVLFFAFFNVIHLIDSQLINTSAFYAPSSPTIFDRIVARFRSFTYCRLSGRLGRLGLPSFGILTILASATIFLGVIPFYQHPYLRELFRYGSPPLSVRCAFIMSALTPLAIALAGKVNIISLLTGVCYSRLNVFHRYVGYALFCLSTTHTVPHLIAPIRDGGIQRLSQMYKDKKRELSGTPLYAVMFGLTFFSIPWARKKAYELFACTHIIMGWAFVGLLYWHVRGEYMSPYYLYATMAVLATSNLLRIFCRNRIFRPNSCHKLTGYPTTLQALSGGVVRVTVSAPRSLLWTPGQHAYIRIPSLSLFDNHPFTIASMPKHPSNTTYPTNDLVFLIRAHRGFTHTLSSHIRKATKKDFNHEAATGTSEISADLESQQPTSQTPLLTLIDGPYGFMRPLHRRYNTVVLIAGGTGITSILPHALHLTRQMRAARNAGLMPYADYCVTTAVRLVWLVRSAEWIDWIQEELRAIIKDGKLAKGWGCFEIDVFVTKGGGAPNSSGSSLPTPFLAPLTLPSESESNLGLFRVGSDETLVQSQTGLGSMATVISERTVVDGLASPTTISEFKEKNEMIHINVAAPKGSSSFSTSGLTPKLAPSWQDCEELTSFVNVHHARPRIGKVLEDKVNGPRSMVVACGPDPLKIDIANTVAQMQNRVLQGDAREISLHTETFGW